MSQDPAVIVPTTHQINQDPDGWATRWVGQWRAWGVAEYWCNLLVRLGPQVGHIGDGLAQRLSAGERVLPAPEHVFRALSVPPDGVRVLIIGQDPYPTEGHPVGLAFACDAAVRPLPRSLVNIYQELADDAGVGPARHGDLSAWLDQGVMLLNTSLTVARGQAGSHAGLGWQAVTQAVVEDLGARQGAPVAILWGRHAQGFQPQLQGHPVITSPHPSPLSARRGFFGSKPFTQANAALEHLGYPPVNWNVERS